MGITPLRDQEGDLARLMVGLWRLTTREDYDGDGRRLIDPHLGADPIGLLAFSETSFSAQFSKRDRSAASGTISAPSENNSSAVGGYDAYFGSYRVDESGGSIVVHLEGSISPANVGREFTRAIRASESELVIRLETVTDDGTPITRTLTFERLN